MAIPWAPHLNRFTCLFVFTVDSPTPYLSTTIYQAYQIQKWPGLFFVCLWKGELAYLLLGSMRKIWPWNLQAANQIKSINLKPPKNKPLFLVFFSRSLLNLPYFHGLSQSYNISSQFWYDWISGSTWELRSPSWQSAVEQKAQKHNCHNNPEELTNRFNGVSWFP